MNDPSCVFDTGESPRAMTVVDAGCSDTIPKGPNGRALDEMFARLQGMIPEVMDVQRYPDAEPLNKKGLWLRAMKLRERIRQLEDVANPPDERVARAVLLAFNLGCELSSHEDLKVKELPALRDWVDMAPVASKYMSGRSKCSYREVATHLAEQFNRNAEDLRRNRRLRRFVDAHNEAQEL